MADGYEATHAVPPTGLPAWPVPDGSGPRAATLDPGLDIEVFERRADWAHIRCSNGWEAWIDGRNLVPLPAAVAAPTAAPEPAPAAVPDPTPDTDAPVEEAPEPPVDAPSPTAHTDAPVEVAPEPLVDAPAPTAHVDAPVPAAATAPAPTRQPDAWAAGAAPPPRRRFEFGVARVLVIVGSVLAAVATLLPWLEISSSTFNAFDVPLNFLRDGTTEDGGVKIGVVVAVLAGLGLVSAFVRPVRWFGIVTGVVILGIGVRFVMEVEPLLDELEEARIFEGRFDVLQYGTYVAMAGGVLALVGGVLSLRKSR